MMPRHSSCTPARKVIDAASVAKPETGLPKNNFSPTIQRPKKTESTETRIPTADTRRSGTLENAVMPVIASDSSRAKRKWVSPWARASGTKSIALALNPTQANRPFM